MKVKLGLAAAAGVAVFAAFAAPASAQTSGEDSVTGTARIVGGGTFIFDAHSGPWGENPSGSVDLIPPSSGTLFTTVTCLAVDGNRATVGINLLGSGLLVFVEDNGATGSDAVVIVASSGFPPDCSSPLPPEVSLIPVVGDIQVVDSVPIPTAKDQCKNGGWRNYPGFENQGACVSFVATAGKNSPAG